VELGVASHPDTLVHEDNHFHARHHEDGLGEGLSNHAGQGIGVSLDHLGVG
jgi:hypothetical protein